VEESGSLQVTKGEIRKEKKIEKITSKDGWREKRKMWLGKST
jgi:hypothetical protein